jgi:dTDP-4-dehydrorhamnose 3,5-epimerase
VIFTETTLRGAFVIAPELQRDERGFFARMFCRDEFLRYGLNPDLAQCSVSFNAKKGTLRGLHYQVKPFEETKLVRCTRGAIYDVLVDIRPESPTYRRWTSIELTQENRTAVYIPEGFAHGFQTLTNECEVLYCISQVFKPDYACGILWDDPTLGIAWPAVEARIISEKDLSYAQLK